MDISKTIMVYGDSMSWGIVPGSRNRLPFDKRWPGVMQHVLGSQYRVIEECLNGRTTRYEDRNRPGRQGTKYLPMLLASHSPVDLLIIMLGINDFQDAIGAPAQQSAEGLYRLVKVALAQQPEPMTAPAKILVIIQPEIQQPLGPMAEKFSGFSRGADSEQHYGEALAELDVQMLYASAHVSLSTVDGVHLDAPEHRTLGNVVAEHVQQLLMH